MAPVENETNEWILVYLAGSPVNGRFVATNVQSGGYPMYRMQGSNIGLLRFDDGKWYISDCGEEFTPAGEDHLDYYVTTTAGTDPVSLQWGAGEDGVSPVARLKWATESTTLSMVQALRAAADRYIETDMNMAILHYQSVVALKPSGVLDFLTLARLQVKSGDHDGSWNTLISLSNRSEILRNEFDEPLYSVWERKEASSLLMCSRPLPARSDESNVAKLVEILRNRSIYIFIEFLLSYCDELKSLLDIVGSSDAHFFGNRSIVPRDSATIARLLAAANARRAFQLAGGMDVAINLRELYRDIERFTFDSRDSAVSRMKIFSHADSFRQFASDGRLDPKGRDGTFKLFWEVGRTAPAADVDTTDPREKEAKLKDLDPAKEMKCSVIKSINESSSDDEDKTRFGLVRAELLSRSDRVWSLAELQRHDCNDPTLKLISIHGVVFDVTNNLEKYAPDGEYYFFPGHDISHSLAVSSLSGELSDQFFRYKDIQHFKRMYGWMDYFDKKYPVVGMLGEYKNEAQWEFPAEREAGDDTPCCIM